MGRGEEWIETGGGLVRLGRGRGQQQPGGGQQPSTPPVAAVTAGAQTLGLVSAVAAASVRVYVSTTGSDSGDGSIGNAFRTVQRAINAAPSGATIVVRGGSYHESLTSPSGKSLTITCQPGETVWFDGTFVITGWQQQGAVWVAPYSVTLPRFEASRFPGADLRNHPDQVWIGSTYLTQVADGTTPGPGQFSVDQNADTLTIGSNPAGKTVRAVDLTTFLTAAGPCSLIGIGVRRYSPTAVEGLNALAYFGGSAHGSAIRHCVFEWSWMAAVQLTKNDITFEHNTVRHMGYSGVMGTACDRLDLDSNLITDYNRSAWVGQPATGAIKITRNAGMKIRNNHVDPVVHPCGDIWLDVSCIDFRIYNNTTPGIHAELADGGKIGGVQKWFWVVGNHISGGGIANTCSGYGQYWNNTIEGYSVGFRSQQDRPQNDGSPAANRTNTECPWLCREVVFNNNRFGAPAASGYKLQVIAYDDVLKQLTGAGMFRRMAGNWFHQVPPGSMVQLGKLDGYRNSFNTILELLNIPAIVGGPWLGRVGTNHQGPLAPLTALVAEPMPAEVVEMLGSSTPRIGANPDRKPVPLYTANPEV